MAVEVSTAAAATADPHASSPPAGSRRGGGLGRFIGYRLLAGAGTVVFVLLFNFFLFRMLPGDPAARYRGVKSISSEDLARIREDLSSPLAEQFVTYLRDPLALNGISSWKGEPVWDLVSGRAWPTLVLLGATTVIAVVIGLWIGIKAGWDRGGRFDKVSTGVTLLFYATPEFWLGLLLIMTFSSGIGPFPSLFPSGGVIDSGVEVLSLDGVRSIAEHTVLPASALAAVYLAEYSLIMRASIVDELGQDYLMTARAKGLMDRAVRRHHAVPNASLPTITLIFLNIGFIIGGAITIETVFSYPGLGLLTFEAVSEQDYVLMQALFLVFTLSVIVSNIIADVVIAMMDPRIRT
ncbi:MAG TPA: ABC transporter permease [Nocardioidaceae bacterium]|nr:ABC transporter permease [Nocardioidaceae bacterium]